MEVMVIDYFPTEKNALVAYNNSRQEENRFIRADKHMSGYMHVTDDISTNTKNIFR